MLRNRKLSVSIAVVLFVAAGIGLSKYMATLDSNPEIIYLEQPGVPETYSRPAESTSVMPQPSRGADDSESSEIWKSEYDREAEKQEREFIQKALKHGFAEFGTGGFSDYQTYSTAVLIELADASDPMAQVFAVIEHSIPFENRLNYALQAASLGYTSGLVRIIGSGELTSSAFLNGNAVSLSAMNYGFLVAAARLDDPVAERYLSQDEDILYQYTGNLTDSDRVLGNEVAKKIIDIIEELK